MRLGAEDIVAASVGEWKWSRMGDAGDGRAGGERSAADDTVGEAALGPQGIGAPRALTRKGGKMSNANARRKM